VENWCIDSAVLRHKSISQEIHLALSRNAVPEGLFFNVVVAAANRYGARGEPRRLACRGLRPLHDRFGSFTCSTLTNLFRR
jgi:hypothetical protein